MLAAMLNRMKYLNIFLLFIAIDSSAQKYNNHRNKIDTVALLDPFPEPKNCVSLTKNGMYLNSTQGLFIQEKQFPMRTHKELFHHIQQNKNQITKSKFYVLVDSTIAFYRIINLVNYLNSVGVSNYKVVNKDTPSQRREIIIERKLLKGRKVQLINDTIGISTPVILYQYSSTDFHPNSFEHDLTDKILREFVANYNETDTTNSPIEISKYHRQYQPYIQNNEKHVLVVCFRQNVEDIKIWKKQLSYSCRFHLLINLAQRNCTLLSRPTLDECIEARK